MDNTSLFAISCGVVLAGFLAWKKRTSFKRLRQLLGDLWHALPRFFPIARIKKVKWRWRRRPKYKEKPRDSDIVEEEDHGEGPPDEPQRKSA